VNAGVGVLQREMGRCTANKKVALFVASFSAGHWIPRFTRLREMSLMKPCHCFETRLLVIWGTATLAGRPAG